MGIPPDYLGKLFSRPSYADASRLKVPYVSVAQLAEQIGGVPA